MRYFENSTLTFHIEPQEFDRHSPREILQYAVGGLLYMPATRTKIADEIIKKVHPEYKSICLDLEDAIGDDTVIQAECCLKETLNMLFHAVKDGVLSDTDVPLIFIRARTPKHLAHLADVCGTEALSVITGFNLPKFDKSNCDEYIRVFKKILEKNKDLYIMPIIESKNVMYSQRRMDQLLYLQNRLSEISDHVLNIRVGATDFSGLFGIRRTVHDTVYDQRVIANCFSDIINMFGRNYVCSGPVWEYFSSDGTPGAWSEGLKKELHMDKLNGFFGKTCIHPSQLSVIAQSNIVSYESYQDAIGILGMSDGLIGVQKGCNNNKMNEVKTHTNWAKKIVAQAAIYGVREREEL